MEHEVRRRLRPQSPATELNVGSSKNDATEPTPDGVPSEAAATPTPATYDIRLEAFTSFAAMLIQQAKRRLDNLEGALLSIMPFQLANSAAGREASRDFKLDDPERKEFVRAVRGKLANGFLINPERKAPDGYSFDHIRMFQMSGNEITDRITIQRDGRVITGWHYD